MEMWVNPACSKCAVALDTLAEAGLEPTQRRYLEQAPAAEELRDVLRRLRLEPWDITRLGEPAAAELGMAAGPMSGSAGSRRSPNTPS
jgi:arsenate reductase